MLVKHIQKDVKYLPLPNRIETVLTQELADPQLTRTSFIMPITRGADLVLANNRRRGLETPGGHIDPGETAKRAARRELLEETGCVAQYVTALGWLRMISEGVVADDWKYPHPLSFQQFFSAIVEPPQNYIANDECDCPVIITASQALEQNGVLSESQRIFYLAACEQLLEPHIFKSVQEMAVVQESVRTNRI